MKRYSIDSTPQVELSSIKPIYKSLGVTSRAGDMCKGHVQGFVNYPERSAFTNRWGCNSEDSLKVKYRCQFIVKLKAIKCFEELLCYLSFYTPFSAYYLLLSLFCS